MECKPAHRKIGVKMNRLLHTLCSCCCYCCCGWLLLLINMELCEGKQTHTAGTYVDSSNSSSFPPMLLLCLLGLVAAWFDVRVCVCVCVFIKLHITVQSGLVILVILCHSR